MVLFKSPRSLGELVKNIIMDTTLLSIIAYPWYVGFLSQQNNTKFFEQAYDSLSSILGVGIGFCLGEVIRYTRNKED